jgi:aspartyl-tRNA(Asn)/glutamyl-tRNA(Gln) amidotransferase subunit B
LPPLVISRDWVEKTRAEMSELPRVMAARFVSDYGLSEYDATTLTQSKAMAAYFEEVAKVSGEPKLASNWVMGEVSKRLNADALMIAQCPVSAESLGNLIAALKAGAVHSKGARDVFDEMWALNKHSVSKIISDLGLEPMSDSGELEKIIDDVLAANAKNVEEVRAGNAKAFNALVGQAMKASKGKANPAQVNDLLRKKLA